MKPSLFNHFFRHNSVVLVSVVCCALLGVVEIFAKPAQARRAPTVEREVRSLPELPEIPRILPDRVRSEPNYLRALNDSGPSVLLADTATPAAQSLQVVSSSGPALIPTQEVGARDFDLAAFQQQIRKLMDPLIDDEDAVADGSAVAVSSRPVAGTVGIGTGLIPPEFNLPEFRANLQSIPVLPGAMPEMEQIEQPAGMRLFPHPADQFGTRERLLMYFPVIPVQSEGERVFMVPITVGGTQTAAPAQSGRPLRSSARVTREP